MAAKKDERNIVSKYIRAEAEERRSLLEIEPGKFSISDLLIIGALSSSGIERKLIRSKIDHGLVETDAALEKIHHEIILKYSKKGLKGLKTEKIENYFEKYDFMINKLRDKFDAKNLKLETLDDIGYYHKIIAEAKSSSFSEMQKDAYKLLNTKTDLTYEYPEFDGLQLIGLKKKTNERIALKICKYIIEDYRKTHGTGMSSHHTLKPEDYDIKAVGDISGIQLVTRGKGELEKLVKFIKNHKLANRPDIETRDDKSHPYNAIHCDLKIDKSWAQGVECILTTMKDFFGFNFGKYSYWNRMNKQQVGVITGVDRNGELSVSPYTGGEKDFIIYFMPKLVELLPRENSS